MSQAETLLNSIAAYPTNDTTVSTSPINDYLIIDAEGRIINVPATETLFGVETDMNAERKYFQCPRIVGDNIDLTKLGLRVNYRNALGEEDGYIVDDVKVNGEFITFSWKLGKKLFAEKGTIYFTVCAVSVDADGYETCHWNTTLASGTVLEGLHVDLSYDEYYETSDLLQQLLNMFQTKSDETIQSVTNEGTKQIGNVETTGSEQRALIESKGAETLATIPEDYTSTYNAADEAIRKKAKAILLEEEGEVISVSDASDDYVRGLKVFGKSEQVKTTGYQLFDVSALKTYSDDSVSIVPNEDGSITISGSGTLAKDFGVDKKYTHGETVTLVKPGEIHLTADKSTSPYVYMHLSNSSGKLIEITNFSKTSESATITDEMLADETTIMKIGYYGIAGKTIVPGIIKPMVYQDGDGTWEPFSSGKPSPSPEYPQEIASVGDSGGINAIVGSRNLFNKNSTNESNSMILFPGTYYCKRFFGDSTETNARLHIKIGDSWKMIESVGKYDNSNIIVEESAFSWYKDKQKLTLKKSYEIFYGLPQGEKLTIAINEYLESYEGDNNSIVTIPRSLPGIPVSTGGNYTDSNGQQWICDEVDFERGVYVKRVSENAITSNMHTTLKTENENCNLFAFELLKYDYTVFISRSVPGLCNKFKRGSYTVGCFDIGTVADSGWGGKSRITFYVDKSITTVEAFMEYIGDDCVVLTPLATPIETPLTVDELNTFRALHSNYPNTTVLNDSGATMQLFYNADTEMFVRRNGGGSAVGGGSISVLDVYASIDLLKAAHPTGNAGDAYMVNGHLYAWSPTENNWVDAGLIEGERGPIGPQGPQGTQGPKGEDGVGIESIDQTTTSTESGGENVITITLTNGEKYTATIRNGSGSISGGGTGEDGVGIQSITQTTKSSEDDGINVVTITLTNGNKSTFEIQNGSKGSTGATGPRGLDGSDATVTEANIKTALGYTPANEFTVSQLSESIEELKETGTSSSSEAIDGYVIAEAERVAEAVHRRQHEGTFTIMACSDLHFSYEISNTKQQQESLKHLGQAMEYIRKSVNIDLAVMLGDIHWDHGESVGNAMKGARYVNRCLYGAFNGVPSLRLRGNHDCLYNSETGLTDEQMCANIGIFNKELFANSNNNNNNNYYSYGYIDFPVSRVRVIFLNTSEGYDGSFYVSSLQNTWLNSALDFSSKDSPDEWGVIIVSHHPLDWNGSNSNVMQTIKNATNIICTIHGHVHGNLVGGLVGTNSEISGIPTPRIATPNACFGRENEYGENGGPENSEGTEFGETVTYKKTAKTCNDTAFVIYTFDTNNAVVYADNYGSGYGRVIPMVGDIEIPTYTITRNLTNVSCLNSKITSLQEGASFGDVLTGDTGFKVGTVKVTMGGVDITDECCSYGKISIPFITGNIVITASDEEGSDEPTTPSEPTVNYKNLVPTSTNEDGSIYNVYGYKTGYRLNSSGGESEANNAIVSGFIPYNNEIIRAWGLDSGNAGETGNYVGFYDDSYNKIHVVNGATTGITTEQVNGKYQMTLDKSQMSETIQNTIQGAKFIRCSLSKCLDPTSFVVTLDEEIS